MIQKYSSQTGGIVFENMINQNKGTNANSGS